MANLTKLTPKKMGEFLDELAKGVSVAGAASAIGLSRTAMYQRRAADEDFATAWDEAVEAGTDILEDEARRRAVDGVPEPKYYEGAICGTVQKYSDSMLMFMLKARRPGKYRENVHHVHDGKVVSEVKVTIVDPEH